MARKTVGTIAILEALIYTVSAVLLALTVSAATTFVYAISMIFAGYPFTFRLDWVAFVVAFGAGFAAIYLSLLIPTSRSLRLGYSPNT